MDRKKVGELLRQLREENLLTQRELGERLHVSDKAISKWERGVGYPDISFLIQLSEVFHINVEEILRGEIVSKESIGGNMKNTKIYLCPSCHDITMSTGNAEVSCCGRKLNEMELKKASKEQQLTVEEIDGEWFVTGENSMTKEDYVFFIAFLVGDSIQLMKQYPEWNLQARIQRRGHGKLLWYSEKEGLLYQII